MATSRQTLLALRNRLESVGYLELIAGLSVTRDPWWKVSMHRASDLDRWRANCVAELLLSNKHVCARQLEAVFGGRLMTELVAMRFLQVLGDRVVANYSVISVLSQLLIIEQPTVSWRGRLVSTHTYLSTSTIDLAHEVLHRKPTGRVLELGCGTGLLSMLARQTADAVLATDIDLRALRLAQLNFAINGCDVRTMHTDLFRDVTGRFDTIVFNPPWRIVPRAVRYPNRLARVGTGKDGLGFVRRFLRECQEFLTDGGSIYFPMELPEGLGRCQFERELEIFAASTKASLSLTYQQPISVETQATITSETCIAWNAERSIEALRSQILNAYANIRCEALQPAFCAIENDRVARVRVTAA